MEHIKIQQELLPLYKEKFQLLDGDHTDPECLNEFIYLRKCLDQKTIYPYYNWTSYDDCLLGVMDCILVDRVPYNWVSQVYYNEFKLKQKSHFPQLQEHELTQFYVNKQNELIKAINHETDELKVINYRMELFYALNEFDIMKNKRTITKQQSDEIIDRKITGLNELLKLLKTKLDILSKRIENENDPLAKVNYQIEKTKLHWEIEAKEKFIMHYKERKNIY